MINRRQFLKWGLGAGAGFASNLASFNAFSADTSDYKALVCVFLDGGHDAHSAIIPYDTGSLAQFVDIRSPLGDEGGRLDRDNLLALSVHDIYQNGNMAVVGNVGPLVEPTNRTAFDSGAARLPPQLFSHNDQASVWMASRPEGARAGWGGRFGDIMQAAGANASADFTLVSAAGNRIFTTGETLNGYHLSSSGGARLDGIESTQSEPWGDIYKEILFGLNIQHNNLFRRDLREASASRLENTMRARELFREISDPETSFPDNQLGDQLKSVAQMIKIREELGMSRQIYFVSHGSSYDTHSNQVEALDENQPELAASLEAFYDETVAMGLSDNVTTFTASDFGRTLVPNGSGTDHGWGNHHFVMGGAVNGGNIYGNIPEAEVDHNQDVGRGRLIPEVSVDQFAFSLARWFGLSESEALEVLPNSTNHDFRALNAMFGDNLS